MKPCCKCGTPTDMEIEKHPTANDPECYQRAAFCNACLRKYHPAAALLTPAARGAMHKLMGE
jgi:hypothetical protein